MISDSVLLLWSDNLRATATSFDELEALIAEIELSAQKLGVPIAVEFQATNSTALVVALGDTKSHLEFVSTEAPPRCSVSKGPWIGDERVVVDYMGVPSSSDLDTCVPIEQALAALRLYCSTGVRPENITWLD